MILKLLLRCTYPQIANKILEKDLDLYALECLSKITYPQLSFKIYQKLLQYPIEYIMGKDTDDTSFNFNNPKYNLPLGKLIIMIPRNGDLIQQMMKTPLTFTLPGISISSDKNT